MLASLTNDYATARLSCTFKIACTVKEERCMLYISCILCLLFIIFITCWECCWYTSINSITNIGLRAGMLTVSVGMVYLWTETTKLEQRRLWLSWPYSNHIRKITQRWALKFSYTEQLYHCVKTNTKPQDNKSPTTNVQYLCLFWIKIVHGKLQFLIEFIDASIPKNELIFWGIPERNDTWEPDTICCPVSLQRLLVGKKSSRNL